MSNRDGIADFDDTVSLIYEAALDPALWPAVLKRITNQARSTCTVMLVLGPGTARPVHLLFDQWPGYDQFVAHYADIDPRNAYALGQPAGAKFTDYHFTTEAEMARNEFYQDYLLPLDLSYVGASILNSDRYSLAGIAIQRARRQGPFEPKDLGLLDRLAPHLTRALRLRTRYADLEAQRWADQTMRDRLPFAVILVDECGRVVSLNQAAMNLLAAADGLTEHCGRFRTAHPSEQSALDRLIRDATVPRNGTGAPVGGATALRRPSLRRPFNVFVMPIPRQGKGFSLDLGAAVAAALVIVTDPEAVPLSPAAVLQSLFGLTPAEALLAQVLAAGKSLKEYADEAQVTCETARWRLKQVLAKTDTHRQAELVRLLLASAGLGGGIATSLAPGQP